jgi:hypothetical protein
VGVLLSLPLALLLSLVPVPVPVVVVAVEMVVLEVALVEAAEVAEAKILPLPLSVPLSVPLSMPLLLLVCPVSRIWEWGDVFVLVVAESVSVAVDIPQL